MKNERATCSDIRCTSSKVPNRENWVIKLNCFGALKSYIPPLTNFSIFSIFKGLSSGGSDSVTRTIIGLLPHRVFCVLWWMLFSGEWSPPFPVKQSPTIMIITRIIKTHGISLSCQSNPWYYWTMLSTAQLYFQISKNICSPDIRTRSPTFLLFLGWNVLNSATSGAPVAKTGPCPADEPTEDRAAPGCVPRCTWGSTNKHEGVAMIFPLVMTNSSPWKAMAHRNRWLTYETNGGSFHGYVANNQVV